MSRTPSGSRFELQFPARADQLQAMRKAVREFIDRTGCDAELAQNLVLAVNEACMNVIQHAYCSDSKGEIVLKIINNGKELLFELTDFAEPVDVSCIRPRDLSDIRPGGLGTHFIQQVMDDIDYSQLEDGRGNRLRMRKLVDCAN